jgi:hypothetical protein
MNNILETLYKPFTPDELEKKPGRGGKQMEYVPVNLAIIRADEAWDGNWSFVIEKSWIESGYALVQGYVQDCNGNKRSSVAGKILETYSRDVTNKYGDLVHQAGEFIDISDDFKGAASYCLRKCLWEFGIGLYLSDKGAGKKQQRPQEKKPDLSTEFFTVLKQVGNGKNSDPAKLDAWLTKTVGHSDKTKFQNADWQKAIAGLKALPTAK